MNWRGPLQLFTSATVAAATSMVREAALLFRPLGLTVPQFDALELLAHAERGMRPSQLAESLIVDPSSTTYLVDQLLKRGWVTREQDPDDRRAYCIRISPAGAEIHARASKVYHAALEALGRRIDPRQMEAATALLSALPALAADAARLAPSP
jgi:DNA-binding MarR family transcriptional regulator